MERNHPAGILRRQGADLVKLLHLPLLEPDVDSSQIFLELFGAFGADDDGGDERLSQHPSQGDGGSAGVVSLGDGAQNIKDAPGALLVDDREVESGAA